MTNNDLETASAPPPVNRLPETDEPSQYRELKIEPRQPAWHVTIDPPITYDGKTYSELVFDYDSLNGKDFQRAERLFNRHYRPEKDEIVIPETKHLFRCILAGQTANVPYHLIEHLERRYYVPVVREAVKACGSSLDEDKA